MNKMSKMSFLHWEEIHVEIILEMIGLWTWWLCILYYYIQKIYLPWVLFRLSKAPLIFLFFYEWCEICGTKTLHSFPLSFASLGFLFKVNLCKLTPCNVELLHSNATHVIPRLLHTVAAISADKPVTVFLPLHNWSWRIDFSPCFTYMTSLAGLPECKHWKVFSRDYSLTNFKSLIFRLISVRIHFNYDG